MNKNQKILIFSILGVVVVLIAIVVTLLVKSINSTNVDNEELAAMQARADSLAIANDRLQLTNEFNELNADFMQYEDQKVYLKNDTLIAQYDAARKRVESLIKELNAEKRSNDQNRQKIKELQEEIATLKGIVKHYLEEIQRLGIENEGLKQEIQEMNARNEELSSQVSSANSRNNELTQTVNLAKKLNVTSLSLTPYNKKGKAEKNVTKATQLGVSFIVAPNNTAAPGMKTFGVRITTPEGTAMTGGGTMTVDGSQVGVTATRQVEYANQETKVTIYCNVNTTLTPGDYIVDVFCDGNRLVSRHFTLKK